MMVNLDELFEGEFLLEYYCGMQPSEVNALPFFEFRRKLSLLGKYRQMGYYDETVNNAQKRRR